MHKGAGKTSRFEIAAKFWMNLSSSLIIVDHNREIFSHEVTVRVLECHETCRQRWRTCKRFKHFEQRKLIISSNLLKCRLFGNRVSTNRRTSDTEYEHCHTFRPTIFYEIISKYKQWLVYVDNFSVFTSWPYSDLHRMSTQESFEYVQRQSQS